MSKCKACNGFGNVEPALEDCAACYGTGEQLDDNYSRGRAWAVDQLSQGASVEHIEGLLDGMPPREFDQGAIDVLRERVQSTSKTVEIERRFLVRGDAWTSGSKAAKVRMLTQGYLSVDPACTVRVRVDLPTAYLTLKGKKSAGGAGSEYEYEIPPRHATELIQLCGNRVVTKYRHTLRHAGKIWEIDEFLGANHGLVVAEIELDSEDETFARPEWLGEEVTADGAYSNASLAVLPYRDWGPR